MRKRGRRMCRRGKGMCRQGWRGMTTRLSRRAHAPAEAQAPTGLSTPLSPSRLCDSLVSFTPALPTTPPLLDSLDSLPSPVAVPTSPSTLLTAYVSRHRRRHFASWSMTNLALLAGDARSQTKGMRMRTWTQRRPRVCRSQVLVGWSCAFRNLNPWHGLPGCFWIISLHHLSSNCEYSLSSRSPPGTRNSSKVL
ncbi:hypothetical protein B0H13DRAFT_919728 [Mycena leptocephala]|nr:hypothetical protein B0H13DRAFT_919728 [Mycena leptocephala]